MNHIIKITTEENGKQTVNARELHAFLESKRQYANWIKQRIEKYELVENTDFTTINKIVNRQILKEYHITLDMAKQLAMVENNEQGRKARKYFIECEKQLQSPALTKEQQVLAVIKMLEADLQKATETKAEIGSRREATAMNTASQATKKANRLEQELDKSKQYASVKRMSMLFHGQKFNWRELKHASQEMELPPIEIFDANYGTVKAYHNHVWNEVYALDIPA